MKRRGFLGAIAAGLGLAATTKADPLEKYYKAETIDRNKETEEILKLYDHGMISGSGVIEYIKPETVACSGVIPHYDIKCNG